MKPDSLQNGQTRVNRGNLLRSLALRILRVDDGKKKTNKGAIKLIPKQKQKDRPGRSAKGFALMFSLGGVGFGVCASVSRCPF